MLLVLLSSAGIRNVQKRMHLSALHLQHAHTNQQKQWTALLLTLLAVLVAGRAVPAAWA
jgi:hypothetical protein